MNTRQFLPLVVLGMLLSIVGCSEQKPVEKAAQAPVSDQKPISVSHILIVHADVSGISDVEKLRTKDWAMAFAEEISELAHLEGADFGELAKKYSDCPTSSRGGHVGVLFPSNMPPTFAAAVVKLKIGEISGPVETEQGIHIILRKEIKLASAKHILVMWKGSQNADRTSIKRTKAEALVLANEALEKLKAGEKIEVLAKDYSDCPSAAEGGELGEFSHEQMVPAFSNAAFALEAGGISEIVESEFG